MLKRVQTHLISITGRTLDQSLFSSIATASISKDGGNIPTRRVRGSEDESVTEESLCSTSSTVVDNIDKRSIDHNENNQTLLTLKSSYTTISSQKKQSIPETVTTSAGGTTSVNTLQNQRIKEIIQTYLKNATFKKYQHSERRKWSENVEEVQAMEENVENNELEGTDIESLMFYEDLNKDQVLQALSDSIHVAIVS
jgi:hypothetical protein